MGAAVNNTELLDDIEYKNGSKNHWRRTMWNRLREQIPDPRDAIILYLPGSKDLDREEALRRGFKPWNLIAIERDRKVAKVLRKKGTITINSDLDLVLSNWPSKTKVSVVIADMQCGLTKETNSLLLWWWKRACFDPVMVINLQRGRESGVCAAFIKNAETDHINKSNMNYLDISSKHRGSLLLQSAISQMMVLIFKSRYKRSPNVDDITDFKWFQVFTVAFFGQSSSVILPTYRSTARSPLFDSLLITKRENNGIAIVRCEEKINRFYDFELPCGANTEVKNCISAALAVRTMKMGH